jgi:hypothetical protein
LPNVLRTVPPYSSTRSLPAAEEALRPALFLSVTM